MNILKKDKVLNELHNKIFMELGPIKELPQSPPEKYFNDLCSSIIGQQLSNTVADVIELRIKKFIGADKLIMPENIITANKDGLRTAGISFSKINYLNNLAELWINGTIKHDLFKDLSDEAIINELVKVKGVGKWTAEMFLMFSLGRKDIFSSGDLILRKKTIQIYNLSEKIKPLELEKFALRWSPKRTFVSRMLWASTRLVKT